ncbi:neutral alpha-glucosidase C-like [Euwallacea similis]|uniref:neutral alpha-glucosidase C-like n=1 Tax=Euwallacea similis TaxID=1736056 RepID=UPI0034509F80
MWTSFPSCLFVLIAAIAVQGDEFPASCSMRRVCSDFRTKVPESNEIYKAELQSSDEVLEFQLKNEVGNELLLIIRGVENNTVRITIEEPDLHRYHLLYSLEKDPVINPLTVTSSDNSSVVASDGKGNSVKVQLDPLQIEVFHNDELQSVFDGNRLIMENTNESQVFTFSVKFNDVKRLMGLHERSSIVSLFHTTDFKRDPYRFKTVDYGNYAMNSTKSCYGAVPLMYAFGNITSGLFFHNAAEMWIDINTEDQSAYFMVYSGVLDIFLLTGPTLPDAVRQYTDLTGKAHLPQLWTLSYHQSRWGYKSEDDVRDIVENYDKYNIPVDAVWMDLDYTIGRRWFTWDPTGFPDPKGLLDWMKSQANRRMVVVSDPHIKIDEDYPIYEACLNGSYFIANEDGSNYVSSCWPGDASWIDFLNPDARDYYAKLHSYDNFLSTPSLGGFWNDMNEPTAFDDSQERSIPYDKIQYGNATHGDVHNMYALTQVMATHQGLMERDEGKLRPFILSRSVFAGSQRYTANWAGDTGGSFDFLRSLVPMTISSNMAGIVFYGGDIPGFLGNPTEELATRWYQTGAWITFFRAHGDQGSNRREPWTFSNETRELIGQSIKLRYQHLPYWYTQFYQHVITGDPIIRGLFYDYPEDDVALDINDEFLIGSDILVANVYFSNATSLRVYLPGENDYWFQITGETNNVHQGGQWYTIPVDITFIPVFYKSGAILSRKTEIGRSTSELQDSYEFHVILDENGNANGKLYYDDFESFEYLNKKYAYYALAYDGVNITALSIDEDADSSGFNPLETNSFYVYTNNGDGTYTKEQFSTSIKML